ncbi:MAG: hypothetical protein FGM46_03735 [Ferruginibacter sp.]|nr:hypothetical protein [Ferruginibacter sp.]
MIEADKRDMAISNLTESYIEMHEKFNELLAEYTTLLIAVNGSSFFEEEPKKKILMANDAALIHKKNGALKKVEIIKSALIDYRDSL